MLIKLIQLLITPFAAVALHLALLHSAFALHRANPAIPQNILVTSMAGIDGSLVILVVFAFAPFAKRLFTAFAFAAVVVFLAQTLNDVEAQSKNWNSPLDDRHISIGQDPPAAAALLPFNTDPTDDPSRIGLPQLPLIAALTGALITTLAVTRFAPHLIPQLKKCPRCQAPTKPAAVFCFRCGKAV